MANPASVVVAATKVLASAPIDAADVVGLDEAALLELQSAITAHRRVFDAVAALTAGEFARRSHRDLGHAGLAQSKGFANAEQFLQSVSGSTRAEAAKLVKVGLLAGASTTDNSVPAWQAPLTTALSAGLISVDALSSILRGLGEPGPGAAPTQLSAAAEQLLSDAPTLNADQLYRRARELRDELDQEGIANRENQQHNLRYLRMSRRPDGMVAGSFLLAQEDGALLTSALDTALSPRRGGPRFTEPTAAARAAELIADPRTNDQLAADTLMAMIRLAVDADPGTIFGSHRPAVRVIVTEQNLQRRGPGHIEGAPSPISFGTVERHLCDTGTLGIKFQGNGKGLDLGRSKRLFTDFQRTALSVRDGGCLFPECERPPSYCEAHHIDQWHRDRGKTDLADGVLLCRFHHMLLHNNSWRIYREQACYFLVPPRAIDPAQRPIALVSKTPAVRELASRRDLAAGPEDVAPTAPAAPQRELVDA